MLALQPWNVIQKRLGYSTNGHGHTNPDGHINNEDEYFYPKTILKGLSEASDAIKGNPKYIYHFFEA